MLEGVLRGATGKAAQLTDGVDANDVPFGTSFPYVALPHAPSADTGKTAAATGTPKGGAGTGAGGTASGSGTPVLPWGAAAAGVALVGLGVFSRRRTRGARATTGNA